MRTSRITILPLIILVLTGLCSGEPSIKPDQKPENTDKADYLLQPSDVIRVKVFQEESLTTEVRISQDFTASFSLIGTVDFRQKTVRQAQEIIRVLYDKDFLVNPQVSVIVLEYAKRSVNVLGSVNAQGQILFPAELGLTLLDAISKANGFTRLADRKKVKLTRTSSDGKKETFIINADDIAGGTTTETWPLIPDDVIFVPERVL